ncbi:nucleoside-diphosphate kinase [Dysgonomonas hofstadii]|uniref:Nucleoside diphosphate kinase n=1 Tax=Dysgonomonas hofstadii TaxID=637886 RepID=A0A840CNE5_9BACT|nr:nucleoside-diphosphate kinase [Dysgonomonas hofstadii]MBB4035588.1 nucleoside-diphosphate kinase [Dysgonomonas hofstadii]
MERTLLILKPSAIQRRLIGEIIKRFEQKGLQLAGMKMMKLDDDILDIHYAHLKDKPFFAEIKNSMKSCPVIVQCWEGIDAAKVVRNMIGSTNGREALPGTIRGDFSMSVQENIVHASDSAESAISEIKRFFKEEELFEYSFSGQAYMYAKSETDS